MHRRTKLITPILLTILGIVLLIGCFPIPATQQLQPDNRLRPEYLIGPEKDKPIKPGVTRIEDAFNEISRQTGSRLVGHVNPDAYLSQWRVSPDKRQFVHAYQIRVATWVVPLCFYLQQVSEPRWLVLQVDRSGVVTGSMTLSKDPQLRPLTPGQWLELFDAPTRAKLVAAGVFPTDAHLRAEEQYRIQYEERGKQMRDRLHTFWPGTTQGK
jgi:hypothetical protein